MFVIASPLGRSNLFKVFRVALYDVLSLRAIRPPAGGSEAWQSLQKFSKQNQNKKFPSSVSQ
jgi:hypothetical protein